MIIVSCVCVLFLSGSAILAMIIDILLSLVLLVLLLLYGVFLNLS